MSVTLSRGPGSILPSLAIVGVALGIVGVALGIVAWGIYKTPPSRQPLPAPAAPTVQLAQDTLQDTAQRHADENRTTQARDHYFAQVMALPGAADAIDPGVDAAWRAGILGLRSNAPQGGPPAGLPAPSLPAGGVPGGSGTAVPGEAPSPPPSDDTGGDGRLLDSAGGGPIPA